MFPSLNYPETVSISLISACVALLAIYITLYFKNKYSYWSKKNVQGPKPTFALGNFFQILLYKAKLDLEWPKKYGKVYGLYFGVKPHLVVNDPEVMLQICVKDFDNFVDHGPNEFLNVYQKNFLFLLGGQHWKKVRALMSPTFTSGKMKRMFKFLNVCADDMTECFKEQIEDAVNKNKKGGCVVNLRDMYNLYTMDAITTCCYGLKLKRDNATNLNSVATRNEFVKLSQILFTFNLPRVLISVAAPKKILHFFGWKQQPVSLYTPLAQRVSSLIEARKKTDKKFDDYLQLLVDAKLEDELELNDMDSEENHHAGLTKQSLLDDQKRMTEQVRASHSSDTNGSVENNPTPSKAKLTDLEVVSSAMFLLAVGLETTSVLLTHASYALAFHQDVQKRLYEEIIKIAQYNEDKSQVLFDYESITTCRYLDAVLSETLRLLTPVFSTDRVAIRDYYLEKYQLHLPAGQVVNMNWYGVMNDPDYWHEPHKFYPDRFMPENKDKIIPGSYCPFGLGPRHCIGMRFSLTEAKLGFAKMIMNFKFEPAPDTVFPPPIRMALGVTKLRRPEVTVLPRN